MTPCDQKNIIYIYSKLPDPQHLLIQRDNFSIAVRVDNEQNGQMVVCSVFAWSDYALVYYDNTGWVAEKHTFLKRLWLKILLIFQRCVEPLQDPLNVKLSIQSFMEKNEYSFENKLNFELVKTWNDLNNFFWKVNGRKREEVALKKNDNVEVCNAFCDDQQVGNFSNIEVEQLEQVEQIEQIEQVEQIEPIEDVDHCVRWISQASKKIPALVPPDHMSMDPKVYSNFLQNFIMYGSDDDVIAYIASKKSNLQEESGGLNNITESFKERANKGDLQIDVFVASRCTELLLTLEDMAVLLHVPKKDFVYNEAVEYIPNVNEREMREVDADGNCLLYSYIVASKRETKLYTLKEQAAILRLKIADFLKSNLKNIPRDIKIGIFNDIIDDYNKRKEDSDNEKKCYNFLEAEGDVLIQKPILPEIPNNLPVLNEYGEPSDEDVLNYIKKTSNEGVFLGTAHLFALAQMYGRPIVVMVGKEVSYRVYPRDKRFIDFEEDDYIVFDLKQHGACSGHYSPLLKVEDKGL